MGDQNEEQSDAEKPFENELPIEWQIITNFTCIETQNKLFDF